jgi:hypothetical protein
LPTTPEQQLAGFIAKFSPEIGALLRSARKKMREHLPRATELVYDNYNFLVIGFGPNDRPSDAIFSIAGYARGVNLFFLQGAGVKDPKGLLRGSGRVVRSMRLESAAMLDKPEVRALIAAALDRAKTPIGTKSAHKLIIRAVAEKQRPRRAAASAAKKRKAASRA